MSLPSMAWIALAVIAALAFYLSTTHQRCWKSAQFHAQRWRLVGCIAGVLSTGSAILAIGTWPGVFAAFTAMMLAMVILPYVDAWRHSRRGRVHVD